MRCMLSTRATRNRSREPLYGSSRFITIGREPEMPTILSGLAACQKQGVCVCYLCDIPPSGPNPWHPPLPTHYT